jgi:hypothetical protein
LPGSDWAPLAVEYGDRWEAVFVFVDVGEPQLMSAVHRVEVSSTSSMMRRGTWRKLPLASPH